MRILTASDRALLVEVSGPEEAMAGAVAWQEVAGVEELIPAARTVLVRFDPARIPAAKLARSLAAHPPDAGSLPSSGEVHIPVYYDGEDLDAVAQALGVAAEEVVARHLAAEWRVAFTGFAPGFGYVIGDDPLFDVPRRSSPRTRVPAGAVALAGRFTGVYPRESPGGWQLIGHTDAVMWDVLRDPPALLSPGTRVRFERAERPRVRAAGVDAGAGAMHARGAQARGAAAAGSPDSDADSSIEVVRPGLQLLVQDRGRPGHAALGVSASGAADRIALRDANRAVGNPPNAAVLECVGAATLRFRGAGVAVITGAVGELWVVSADGAEREVAHGVPFATAPGDELELGWPRAGFRYTVGVRGGIRVPLVLGSAGSDTLSGLGAAPLGTGDVVAVGSDAPCAVDPDAVPRALPAPGDLVDLEITLGPRDNWFTEAAREVLFTQEWEVTAESDRIGIRLLGALPLERAQAGELPSEAAVTGAIQVPADGQPVIFLADHPLTAGYPIIGALTTRTLDLAAQLPPGARIRFRPRIPAT